MKKTHAVIAAMALMMCGSALAERYDLPKDIPARKPGLWEEVETGTVGPNKVAGKKQYCLDAKADRALYELDILRKELQVVNSDITCQAPSLKMDGKVLTGDMACRTNATNDDPAAGQDFHWETTFTSDSEVSSRGIDTPKDVLLLTQNNMTDTQKRLGECPADMQPGDYIDFGFSYGRQKMQDKPRRDTIYNSIKIVTKLLNEGLEINKRLGPM